MSEAVKKCEHGNVEFDVTGHKDTGTNVIRAEIAARCADCGKMFRWIGRYKTEISIEHAAITEDGMWLSLPMVPEDESPHRTLIKPN